VHIIHHGSGSSPDSIIKQKEGNNPAGHRVPGLHISINTNSVICVSLVQQTVLVARQIHERMYLYFLVYQQKSERLDCLPDAAHPAVLLTLP
jgi:hypothetical protein